MGFWLYVTRQYQIYGMHLPEEEFETGKYVLDKEFICTSNLKWVYHEVDREVVFRRPADFTAARTWLRTYGVDDGRSEGLLAILDRMEVEPDLWFEPSY